MRGNDTVIALLNEALREELTAINQYFIHAEMCHNWGYHGIGSYIRKQSIDEMKHAEKLIERILFLDGTPKMEYLELNVGGDVRAQLEADFKLEVNAVAMYNKAVQVAREAGDDQSRELLSALLKDEEEHVDWLEAQLHQIKELGYERYLMLQVEGKNE
jgi:bacterioferritin